MNNLFDIVVCPKSKKKISIDSSSNRIVQKDNNFFYDMIDNIPVLFNQNNIIDEKIKAWWEDLYKQLYDNYDKFLTKEKLILDLERFHDLMKKQNHLLAQEMLSNNIKNKICLEIGSGSGAHSALMKFRGANIVSVDITYARCKSTKKKLDMIDDSQSLVLNCSGENLPIDNNSVDYVYSNGVLHHANNTENCISEVHRVLKKKGKAIIMLYCRSSVEYYFNILPKAIFTGAFFRQKSEEKWVGEVTEGKTKFGNIKNPITRVYNKNEISKLFENFDAISLRKHYFSFKDFSIPKLTQLREKFLHLIGSPYHDGGNIVYGKPVIPLTKLEKSLGKFFGFFWYVVVQKK